MRVAPLVFRYRFWVFALAFGAGFGAYAVDHVPLAARLARALGDGRVTSAGVRLVFAAGALLVIAAAALRTWATAYLRSAVVHDATVHAEALVADGPYRHVRNPLYLGGMLMAVGFAPSAPALGAALMVGGVLAVSLALVATEEGALAAAMPERFAAYRARVPAFVPALRPRLRAGDARPAWAQAVVGEAFFWAFALGAVALAATLDARWAGGVALVGFVLQSTLHRRLRARGAPVTARTAEA